MVLLPTQLQEAWSKATQAKEEAEKIEQLLGELNQNSFTRVSLDALTKEAVKTLYLAEYETLKTRLRTITNSLP